MPNVALNKPINSYSSQYSPLYTADKINNGNYTWASPWVWLSASGQTTNQWIIIDLEELQTIDRVVMISCYYSITPTLAVKNYRIGFSTTGTDNGSFTIVASGSLALPTAFPPPSASFSISPTQARYIKVYCDTKNGSGNYLMAGELEAYQAAGTENLATIDSNATISTKKEYLATIQSGAWVGATSHSEIILADSNITKETINSAALIIKESVVTINSAGNIRKESVVTINSDGNIAGETVNVALNKPINSYSSQYSPLYTADKINNGNYTWASPWVWLSASGQTTNQWIIIDLEELQTIDRVVMYSCYYPITPTDAMKAFRIGFSTTGTDNGSFTIVASGSLALPSSYPPPYANISISPAQARYIKVYIDTNWGTATYCLAGEFEAYTSVGTETSAIIVSNSRISIEFLGTILSNYTIKKEFLKTIQSDSNITKETINSNANITKETINSEARIWRPAEYVFIESAAHIAKESVVTINSIGYVTKETINSDARILNALFSNARIYFPMLVSINSDGRVTKETINSNALIVPLTAYINSDSWVYSPYGIEIVQSDARVLQSGSIGTSHVLIVGTGTPLSSSRDIFISSQAVSSSQTIVQDIFTSTVLDLTTASTPLTYNEYDWAYDWVTRQWNNCVTRFEARQSDNIYNISGDPWSEIVNGQLISKSNVKRYHQFRIHLWASGSRDFELHQFSIKGYVVYPSNKIYASIII